jgi:hypothetical protein
MIVVPLVLAGPVRHAYSYQSRHIWLGLTSPHSSHGSGWQRGHESLAHHVAKVEDGVTGDPTLASGLFCLAARPGSFGPSLADVSWAARPAN